MTITTIPVSVEFLKHYALPSDVRHQVEASLTERHYVGIAKYGVPLTPHNGRNSFKDIYEEFLDAYIYTTNVLLERGIDPSKVDLAEMDASSKDIFKLLTTTLELILIVKERFPCN